MEALSMGIADSVRGGRSLLAAPLAGLVGRGREWIGGEPGARSRQEA